MALLTISEVRSAGQRTLFTTKRSAETLLNEASETVRTTFDVFLSHSRLDAELILGMKAILEAAGLTVYIDWIDDRSRLNRDQVTPATAAKLRERMRQSKSLFYVHSSNATKSRWMPWELGYFDGFNGNVAILPIVQSQSETFRGEEYLGLYPYVDVTGRTAVSPGHIFIHRDATRYARWANWRESADKLRPAA